LNKQLLFLCLIEIICFGDLEWNRTKVQPYIWHKLHLLLCRTSWVWLTKLMTQKKRGATFFFYFTFLFVHSVLLFIFFIRKNIVLFFLNLCIFASPKFPCLFFTLNISILAIHKFPKWHLYPNQTKFVKYIFFVPLFHVYLFLLFWREIYCSSIRTKVLIKNEHFCTKWHMENFKHVKFYF
jgi:hypothetical protein